MLLHSSLMLTVTTLLLAILLLVLVNVDIYAVELFIVSSC